MLAPTQFGGSNAEGTIQRRAGSGDHSGGGAQVTGDRALFGADVVGYSVIAPDLHLLLVAGLPAHCERVWTLP
jgi:hypothetical protein